MFRRRLILFFILCIPFISKAQAVDENYDRLTITHILILYKGEKYNGDIQSHFLKQYRSDKYNQHQVRQEIIYLPRYAKNLMRSEKVNLIKETLQDNNIPKAIIEKWYNRSSDGVMDLNEIHQRGSYNADDYDFTLAQLTKRGNSELKDYGNKLINKSYIIVTEISNIIRERDKRKSKYHGYSSENDSYIYKLNYNPKARNKVYDSWIYSDDSQSDRDKKRAIFNRIAFTIRPVTQISKSLYFTQSNEAKNNIFYKYKSDSELFEEMIDASYSSSMEQLSTNLEDFRIKTFIDQKGPLRAKIGLKEGLVTDQQFYVYEYVWDEMANKAVPKRKAIIRVSGDIADNRNVSRGNSNSSTFYQTGGWTIQEGMLIQQKNDMGISVTAGWELGAMGGLAARVDARVGSLLRIPALYAFVDGNISKNTYSIGSDNNQLDIDFTFYKFSIGIAKGFNFAYNFEIIPFVSYGIEFADPSENFYLENDYTSTEISKLKTSFFKLGTSLAMNITPNLQFFGTIGVYLPIGDVVVEKDTKIDMKWTDVFSDRDGATKMFGVRVLF